MIEAVSENFEIDSFIGYDLKNTSSGTTICTLGNHPHFEPKIYVSDRRRKWAIPLNTIFSNEAILLLKLAS